MTGSALKYYFYTVTASGMTHNGVLSTALGYFPIRFLIQVAFKGKPNVLVHWWTEITQAQCTEYAGKDQTSKMEAVSQPKPATVLRLVLPGENRPARMNLDMLISRLEELRDEGELKGRNVAVSAGGASLSEVGVLSREDGTSDIVITCGETTNIHKLD